MGALDPVFSSELKIPAARREQLEQFQEHIRTSGCKGCSLHETRQGGKPVPGEGRGRVLFVGHRIGQQEADRARPAIGEASQYGFKLLADVLPISRDLSKRDARAAILDYSYMTNAARCGRDVSPSAAHWKRCAGSKGPNWLRQEIGLVDPVIIVFWNKQAARTVLPGGPPARGQIETMEFAGRKTPVMLMTHPVRVAREPEEKVTVRGDFKRLTQWLSNEGYMDRDPNVRDLGHDTNHKLVTTEEGLEEMKRDLWDSQWVAIDTETFYQNKEGAYEHLQSQVEGGHVAKKGALLWYREGFETTCYQICGLGQEGRTVDRTYTVAMRFRDRLTGEEKQQISPQQAIGALDDLLRHRPGGQLREVAMWNALFDCPVLTREGLDMWGLTHTDYEVRIWDGQIIMGRLHEHLGRKEGKTTLDNAASVYLQERKGSFTDRFDVQTFAYTDIEDPKEQQHLLDYTGEDPRKTLLATLALFDEMNQHLEDRSRHLTRRETGLPEMGFSYFQRPASHNSGSRFKDVAIPVDHQMIPLIGEMEMLGFKFDTSSVEEAGRYAKDTKRQLLNKIQSVEPGFNPNSASDALSVIEKALSEVAQEIERIGSEHESSYSRLVETYQVDAWRVDGALQAEDLVRAFEDGYDELDAQKDTIKNKLMAYHRVSWDLLSEVAEDLGETVDVPDWAEPDGLETFFTRVFLYKQVDKKYSTYFERFEKLVDDNSVFHPGYLITSTLSGRFSGNFQNVPRGGEEDIEFVEKLLFTGLGMEEPEDENEREDLINEYNRFDVRQACRPVQPADLNDQFRKMGLTSPSGEPWRVRPEDEHVMVGADYAGQEDRMAYAQSGDETKARLLSNPDLDTHFYNVAFCFGDQAGFDTSTEEGVMEAYHHFTKHRDIEQLESEIREAVEDQDLGPGSDYVKTRRRNIKELKEQKKENKSQYRTPMKTVHYASQYGAGVEKLHTVLKPLFMRIGIEWSLEDTQRLKERYDELYSGVVQKREEIFEAIEDVPYLEYPTFGALRHASINYRGEIQDALSVANAYNQGTCAYMTKTAMLRMRHLIGLNAERWNLVQKGGSSYVGINLQVHDEIAVTCPARLAPEVARCLESAMKMIVEPGTGDPYYDTEKQDYRGETGWLVIPDRKYEGRTLFDADAEIKATVAKAKKLADGSANLLASMEEPETMKEFREKHPPRHMDKSDPLTMAKAGHTNYLI